MSNGLAGKVIAITGASAGIGRAIAHMAVERGARVVLNALADVGEAALRADFGPDAEIYPGNIAEPAAARGFLAAGLARFERIDALVNNAGIFYNGMVGSIDLDEVDRLIALNFAAVVRNSYLFAEVMVAQGSGQIINVSSISANLNTPGCGAYAATKRAVEQFSEALRIELAGSGVRVGIIAPGRTATDLFARLPSAPRESAGAPVQPLLPDDLADAVRYMLELPAHANVPHLRLYPADQRN
jgi:serine 3-dehydrogenase